MKKIITSAIAVFVGLSMQAQQEQTRNTLPAERTVQTTETTRSPHAGRGGQIELNIAPAARRRQMTKGELRRAMRRNTVPARLEEETRRR